MEKTRKSKKDLIYYIAALILGLVLLIGGFYEAVTSRIAAHEYKNSSDIRDVTAVVADYKIRSDDDDDSYESRTKYDAKLYFKVDGKTYEGKKTFYNEISKGDMITVTVYKTKKAITKLSRRATLLNFCCTALQL